VNACGANQGFTELTEFFLWVLEKFADLKLKI